MTDEVSGAVERARLLHPSRPAELRCSSRRLVEGVMLECELAPEAHVRMRIGHLDFTRHLAVGPRGDVGWSTRQADR